MSSIKSLRRITSLRARLVDQAKAEVRWVADALEAQKKVLEAGLLARGGQRADELMALQEARDVGYGRLPRLSAMLAQKQSELMRIKQEHRQIEILLEKAVAERTALEHRREVARVDDWVQAQTARSSS